MKKIPSMPSKKSKPKTKRTQFQLDAAEARRVVLAGTFNEWDINTLPMKEGCKGTWRTSVALPPGRYEYRFWVDGVWQDDPNAYERVENPFGSMNCVRIVS
jgi:1,4-alpha-glucan branching enzyme